MIEVELSEKTPMQFYEGDSQESLAFVRLCPNCARFVKPDDHVLINGLDQVSEQPNATCSKCGRVTMIFDGWWPKD
ncbi:hypothetical protein ES703_66553 [subsurface metagenome]